EQARTPGLLKALAAGQRVVLVTDAGMPSVSDPGFRLVAAAIAAGVNVTVVPGPSAVLSALAVSGLPVNRFCFEGFLPRKAAERSRRLDELAAEPRTMVFFESPHRTADSLRAMAQAWGADRQGAVCRELTKTYEEVRRGGLAELASWAEGGVRGEITLVVGGATAAHEDLDEEALRHLVDSAAAAGLSRKDAVATVVRQTGMTRRTVYDAAHRAAETSEKTGGERP
nr:rRNA small subunit methyltransferase 1 [Nocardioidaceae bacterium]